MKQKIKNNFFSLDFQCEIMKKIIFIFWIVIFFSLCVTSFFVTAINVNYTETIDYANNPFILTGIVTLVFLSLLYLFSRSNLFKKVTAKQIRIVLGIYISFLSILWAYIANAWPYWDSLDLIHCASHLGTDNAYWHIAEYMYRYPFQLFYVLVIKLCMKLFGEGNVYFALEAYNAISAGVAAFYIVKLSQILFGEKPAKLTGISLFFFFPLIFFSTFAYGNIPCLPFLIAALYYQIKFMEKGGKRNVIFSSVCVTFGILLKATGKIVLIAIIIIWILKAMEKKNKKFFACALVTVVGYFLITKSFYYAVSARYDVVLNQGVPSIVHISMGVDASMDSAKNGNNPGWYNGRVWLLDAETYSPEAMAELSKDSIRDSIEIFKEDPTYCITFFKKKIIALWCEPTFQSVMLSNWSYSNGVDPVMAEREISDIAEYIYYGNGNSFVIMICDMMQFVILFSTVITALKNRKNLDLCVSLPAIVGIGFFLIYIIWEAKSQYTFTPYVIMSCYTGYSMCIIFDKFSEKVKLIKRN